jgi:hypothetical protein
MLSALQTALTAPASFFERESIDPDLRRPAILVGVSALVGLLSSLPVFRAIVGTAPPGASPFLVAGLAIGAVIGLVAPFVFWFLYALVFYGLSAAFDGTGELRDLFALVGWGFAPKILSQIVGGVVIVVLLSQGDVSTPQQAQQFAQSATTEPLGVLNRGFGLLMTLWSAWIWTYAVAESRELPTKHAAITVGVVVLVEVALGFASTMAV